MVLHRALLAALAVLVPGAACRLDANALSVGGDMNQDARPIDASPDRRGYAIEHPAPVPLDAHPPDALVGPPASIGCSDGTREAFIDLQLWPSIAGCAGAWTRPGVVSETQLAVTCSREAGDTGENRRGNGCSASDLCAEGWHLCASPGEVDSQSLTGCEGAVPPQEQAFFVAGIGATTTGACLQSLGVDDKVPSNDLHGCGIFGQPEDPRCSPLVRRLGFVDCLQSAARGGWKCGTDPKTEGSTEARKVTKTDPDIGGVLCCRGQVVDAAAPSPD